MNWLASASLALLSFGLWGLFTKLSVLHIDAKSALVFQTLGVLIIGIITAGMLGYKPEVNMKGVSFSILTGIAYGVGCLFYFVAASKGKIITVVTFTALYPLITIILAFILLKENVSFKQCLGIGLALISIAMMSS
jgi:transporter family protein